MLPNELHWKVNDCKRSVRSLTFPSWSWASVSGGGIQSFWYGDDKDSYDIKVRAEKASGSGSIRAQGYVFLGLLERREYQYQSQGEIRYHLEGVIDTVQAYPDIRLPERLDVFYLLLAQRDREMYEATEWKSSGLMLTVWKQRC